MTIAEALQYAGDRLDAATRAMTAIRDQIAAQLETTTTNVTTIINQFLTRPPVTSVFVDPINGNDANDGSTIAKARKSIDKAVEDMGANATQILLLNDAQFVRRPSLYAPLTITGIALDGSAAGYKKAKRSIAFLGEAQNSPQPFIGSFSSGLLIYGPVLRSDFIDFNLPDVPAGLDYRSHLISFGSNITLSSPVINASGPNAAALIGAVTGRATVYVNPTLGPAAAGHVFDGVASGTNPNQYWQYSTNLQAA